MQGMSRVHQDAIDRSLSAGLKSDNGLRFNALQTGLINVFAGQYLTYQDTAVTKYSQQSIDADLEPYYILGPSKLLSLRTNDTTAVPNTGIVDAQADGGRGFLAFVNRDVASVGVAMHQENQLWIPGSASFTVCYGVRRVNNYTLGETHAFGELGFFGSEANPTSLGVSTAEMGTDKPFALVRFYGGQARLRVRFAATGAITTSAVFTVPASGSFDLTIDYVYNSASGVGNTTVKVDGNIAVVVPGTIDGPFQLGARVCHGAAYVLATETPMYMYLDEVAVSIPR